MTRIAYLSVGRRKTSRAKVTLSHGEGNLSINRRKAEDYLQHNAEYIQLVRFPLVALGVEKDYNINILVQGGGLKSQAEGIKLGIARALCKVNMTNRVPLKAEGFLTRDSRKKERKKYGLKKARKAPQFSKR
uniref:Ribosomal protein S9 n=1 Tax=Gronococcus sybilensis TaxID=3028029 RepID=A0A9Y1I2S4_9RHOD|nr:ribosomal protein S9 [Gronococcus sybilensis]